MKNKGLGESSTFCSYHPLVNTLYFAPDYRDYYVFYITLFFSSDFSLLLDLLYFAEGQERNEAQRCHKHFYVDYHGSSQSVF